MVGSSQNKYNYLAIAGLVIALLSLFYNTWRHEISEANRNRRTAAFEILKNLGELQTTVHFAHYQKDVHAGNPILGWSKVLFINDLAMVLPDPVGASTSRLKDVWGKNWKALPDDKQSLEAVVQAANKVRETVLAELNAIE
jgi:hypothetical protein